MEPSIFTKEDRKQLEGAGISLEEGLRQIALFENPPGFTKLARVCVPGDGIRRLVESEVEEALAAYERARLGDRFLKFVPASGAATRMFQSLLFFRNETREWSRREIEREAAKGTEHFPELKRFLEGLSRFPFAGALRDTLEEAGEDPAALLQNGSYRPILGALLDPAALDFARLPKGLIPFHGTEDEARTPFEQHLIEAALYARNADGSCRLHFTVSPEHEEAFRRLLERVRPGLEERFGIRYEVNFSAQKPSTDTLAADESNRPFREKNGRLLVRPGGHGALIENLGETEGDIVFIKNIDNVTPRQLTAEVCGWKKALAGHLTRVQERIFRLLARLDEGADNRVVEEAMIFLKEDLGVEPPAGKAPAGGDAHRFVTEKLDRPLRVCGMVPNTGDPGGGPFWVTGEDGSASLQIVESAQIDPRSDAQQEILKASTHFNPVDLVCALRDRRGNPYDLRGHVDESAVFISVKSKDGRTLKAFERPGLWNGAMADWNTVFVEVPAETFSPVKRVTDLLKEEHQGA
ncbi:MAG: DUF4301 family protein [Candidatus Eisenbacteria bacterium]